MSRPVRHWFDVLPVRCSHERVGWSDNRGRAKVSQFDLTWLCQQDVSGLHIPERETIRQERMTGQEKHDGDKTV